MPHYLTKIVASVAQSSTRLGLRSIDQPSPLNCKLERSLVSAASVLPVLMLGTACCHFFIVRLTLQTLNNSKLNFLDKRLTVIFVLSFLNFFTIIFFYHITCSGRFRRAVLYKFYLYYCTLSQKRL